MEDNFLMNVCVVGGNAVSAFLSWRLQATNACDVTLVWKSGFDAVYQYGISFKYVLNPALPDHSGRLITDYYHTGLLLLAMNDSSPDMVRSSPKTFSTKVLFANN
jgi:hypothetical protein